MMLSDSIKVCPAVEIAHGAKDVLTKTIFGGGGGNGGGGGMGGAGGLLGGIASSFLGGR